MAVRMQRVERFALWVLKNIDVVLAAAVALTIGFLEIFGDFIPDDVASGAVLLVLGALALGSIVERVRHPATIEAAMSDTQRALADLTMVRSLAGNEVAGALRTARQGTRLWCFKGGTGTYLRAVTLPKCVAAAREQRSHLTVKIDIINPGDERTCEAYARFREMFASRASTGNAGLWTTDRVRKESYATVLAACWYQDRLATMDISVHLSSAVPTLRFDLSESCLIITQDDTARVNLLVGRDQPLYDYYVTELHQSREQAIPVSSRPGVPLSEAPTVDEARAVFEALDLALPRTYTDSDIGAIITKALQAEDPYRR